MRGTGGALGISEAVEILAGGGVVALPTDTYYCLAACSISPGAARRIFELKGRDASNAVPLLMAETSDVMRYAVNLTERQQLLVAALGERFWPGALSLVLPRSPAIPAELASGGYTIALRVPDAQVVREVARGLGAAVTGTSANLSGSPPAVTAQDVIDAFGDRLDGVVDGGKTPGGPPSTVLDLTTQPARILRPGAISAQVLSKVLDADV